LGNHVLSGFDNTIEKEQNDSWSDTFQVVKFVLDGKTYKASEDPADGYRSYLNDLIIINEKITNTFPPHDVIGKMIADNPSQINDIIEFIDILTNKTVLEIGTADTDDYYPYCVMKWSPENLAINNCK
jgi:hypothetical protein